MSSAKKINVTKNYRMFQRSDHNRVLSPKDHKKLERSMRKNGFLWMFPVVCRRTLNGQLLVDDGQHRLTFAENLELPVYWVESDVEFDIADLNNTACIWKTKDYALKYAAQGIKPYQEGLDFAEQYGLAVSIAFAMLGGTGSYGNIRNAFVDGGFKIKDRKWAELVASIYGPISQMSGEVRNARFLQACLAVCRVETFDPERLLHSVARCREKLVSYSTRDAYLTMLEEIYNFNRVKLVGLKMLAIASMRERNIISKHAAKNGHAKKALKELVPA